jgi:amidase
MSATDPAAAIRSKQVSSREVIEGHLRRIEEVNASVNALVIAVGRASVGGGSGG